MLAKNYRLAKQNDFKVVFEKGKKSFGRCFSIRFLANNLPHSRVAVVVANKVSKKATQRNRLKRQAREIIRLNLAKFSDNYDIIINVLSPALGREYSDLETELVATLQKLRILNA